jgi:O-antigen ligase
MISETTFMVAIAAATLAVWAIVLLFEGDRLTAQRRAGVVFTLAVAQPLALELVGVRTLAATGAVADVSHTLSLIGRAMNVAMVIMAATLLVAPAARAGLGSGRVLIGGVWALAAALFVANLYSPGSGSVQYAFYFAVALTAVALGVPDRVTLLRWARRTTRAVVAISLGAAVFAPSWAFIGEGTLGYDRTVFGVPRLTGLSPHPNALAGIAVVALLLEVGFPDGRKWARCLAGSAAAACMVLTQSNTGYIAAALGLVVLLASRRAAYRRVLVTASIVALSAYVVFPTVVVPAALQSSDYVNTLSGRTQIWRVSLDEWHRHPLTGYGPGMFSPNYVETHFPANLQVTNGHDQVVQTLAESGLLGAIGLIAVVAATVAGSWRARRIDGGLALALVTSFWVFGITETPMRVVGVAVLPALVTLGVVLVASRDALETSREQPQEVALRSSYRAPPGWRGSEAAS